jgi:transposase-like protein
MLFSGGTAKFANVIERRIVMPIDLGLKKIPCPECGADAKRQPKKLFGKRSPGAKFKCTKCGNEFHILF